MDENDFEEQIRLEEEERRQHEGTSDKIRVDPDGNLMEFDEEKRAWFPKIDANFIAQYQMNYGNYKDESTSDKSAETSSNESSIPPAPPVDDPGYYNWYYTYYYPTVAQAENTKDKGTDEQDQEERDRKAYEEYYANYYKDYYNQSQDKMKQGEEEKINPKVGSENYDSDYWNYYLNYYNEEGTTGIKDETSGDGERKDGENEMEKEEKDQEKGEDQKGKKRKAPEKKGWFEMDQSKSTSVYVHGLPTDFSDEEFKELMNKCGLVMFDPFTNKPKLKLYRDSEGNLKGDGLCVYIKPESVELATQILDGYDVKGNKIVVEVAKFEMRGKWDPKKGKRKKMSAKQKQKFKERQERLFGWKLDKPKGFREKHERVIVIKNLFDLKTYETDVLGPKKLRLDLHDECSKYGEVKKVVVYDRHKDGPAMVFFSGPEDADMCKGNLDGRLFHKRIITAVTWDGKEKFVVQETEEEERARLRQWEEYLNEGDASDAKRARQSQQDSKGKKSMVTKDSTSEVKETVTSQDSSREVTESESDKAAENRGSSGDKSARSSDHCGKSGETSGEMSEEITAGVDESGETKDAKSGETGNGKSGEKKCDSGIPGDTKVEKSGETKVEKSGETKVEKSGETKVEKSGETKVEKSSEASDCKTENSTEGDSLGDCKSVEESME